MKAKRAAIYARLSKEDVGSVDNTGIQIEECESHIAQQEGWQHVATFVDDNISAYSGARRPDYERLLDFIRGNQANVLVSTEMTRLNRRLWDSISLFRLAETSAFQQIATTEGRGFDLSTQEGIHNAVNAAIDAEKESLRLSQRQKRKTRKRAREGRRNGGPRPFGYENDGVTIRESEAAIIRELVERTLNGESAPAVVKDFRRRGIKTVNGGEWQVSTVRRLLDSPRMCGIRRHHCAEYPAQWPAIVSRQDWEQVQIVRRARVAKTESAAGRKPRSYLLTGIVTCGNCGTPMIGHNWHDTRSGIMRRRYVCPTDDGNHHRSGCGKVYRVAEPVEILATEAVLYRLDTPELTKVLSAQAHDGELQDLLNQYQSQKDRLKDLIEDYASGLLNREQLTFAKHVVEEALEATRSRLATIQSGRVMSRIPLNASLRDVWDAADLDFKRDLIRLVVEKIVVLPGRSQKLWREKYRFDPNLIEIVWTA